jgi:hypothetical protein
MKRQPIAFLALTCITTTLLLAGCATDVANRYYSATHYPSKDPAKVQVLRREPSRPYKVIADFQSRWDHPESLRVKAAKIGADAVIIVQPGGCYRTDQQWAGHDLYAGSSARICGTAIVYK